MYGPSSIIFESGLNKLRDARSGALLEATNAMPPQTEFRAVKGEMLEGVINSATKIGALGIPLMSPKRFDEGTAVE
ncbi:hypothetical protein A2973_04280 [Candidatus Gottesmanbacteria bacterium RIFCSPLOWO2_01_FULL_49_10]|uniref:Uncharacterized protein n=1 Tax=Candidatus Gottesmanbacteria bacterium RIFCSPLOWO2_01_FULL_49_10 TaxID=1798396 RepID=A0A1F6AYH7_9BACT|nr:MAG: hypothetical protein A2973_04280 [Candidatus Gottesmanbacteria bacterium RIFCSPLOWO2_01_FULL_49_10]